MLLTIGWAGRILDLFTVDRPERGVTEVAGELGLSKSKAHALLASLSDVGLLRRTERGRYLLGWRVLGLNRVLADTTEFRCHARPVMEALGAHLGETVHLGALSDGEVVYVDRVEGTQAVRIEASAIGSVMPAHCSAVGKALLAHAGDAGLEAVLERGLSPLTPRTVTDADVLAEQLAEIRRRGFAVELEEAVPGVSCVAAPILAHAGRGIAALSIAAPARRFEARSDLYRRAAVNAARHVSRRLRQETAERARELQAVA